MQCNVALLFTAGTTFVNCLLFICDGGGTIILATKVFTSPAFRKIYQAIVNLVSGTMGTTMPLKHFSQKG